MADKQIVKNDEVCVVCGQPLPTESGRLICKECEKESNDSRTKNSMA